MNTLKALHEADEERAELEEDEILYCDPDYDPEAARLAELDELERALEMEEELSAGRSVRGRRGRGAGHFRGRGPRIRGAAVCASRGVGRRAVDNDPASFHGHDSDASSSTASTTTSRFPQRQSSPDAEDRAAWFNARCRDNFGGRRRLTMPDYMDWDEDEEDEPEATDIWSPSSRRRDLNHSSNTPSFSTPQGRRGKGRVRGRNNESVNSSTRARRRAPEYWQQSEESERAYYAKRRRRLSSSLYADEMEDSDSISSARSLSNYVSRGRNLSRPSQPARKLDFEYSRPSARVVPNIMRVLTTLSFLLSLSMCLCRY